MNRRSFLKNGALTSAGMSVLPPALLALAGCGKDFLDTHPYDRVASSTMWSSESLTDKGVLGVYHTLRYHTVGYYNYLYFGGMGFDAQIQLPQWMGLLRGTATIHDWLIKDTWMEHYEGIHRANDAIHNIPKKSPVSEEKKGRLVAECKFLRAYFYYRLNVLYQGVPLYTEPLGDTKPMKPRSTVEEIWGQCISDLTDGIQTADFPDNTLGKELYGRASKGAAYALRGMIYMWMKDYQKAANDFKKVKASGYGLYSGNWSDLFTRGHESTIESILPLQFDDESNAFSSDLQQMVGPRSCYDSWQRTMPTPALVDSFQWADGSSFQWADVLPGYDTLSIDEREVFFLRDGLDPESTDSNLKKAYTQAENRIGTAVMNQYYLKQGNEARIKAAYDNRDPRLKQIVMTPYAQFECYNPHYYNGAVRTLTFNWPLISKEHPYDDLWPDKRGTGFYIWRKFNVEGKTDLQERGLDFFDVPLIRYTQISLLLAEALNESDDLGGAIEQVNAIRRRVQMPELHVGGAGPNAVNGKADMRARIRHESRIELANEGTNYFDELRWGTWKESKFGADGESGGRKSFWGYRELKYRYAGDYIWPWSMPGEELVNNPDLKQNPGWPTA